MLPAHARLLAAQGGRGVVFDKLVARDGVVAAVDANGELSTWSLASGAHTRLGRVEARVEALALANGTAITGSEGAITIWSTPPITRAIHGHVTALAASSDRIAVASSHGAIALFTLAGEPRGEVAGHAGGTEAIAFDATGTLLVSGGQDRAVRLWRRDGDAFVAAAALDGSEGDIHHVAFAADRIVAAGNDGRVLAWSLRDGPAQVLARHTGAVLALAIAGDWIVSAGRDAQLSRARLSSGAATSTPLRVAASAVAVDERGTVHAVLRDGSVVRWTDATKQIVDHGARTAVALDGRRWLVATADGALWIQSLITASAADVAELLRATTARDLGR